MWDFSGLRFLWSKIWPSYDKSLGGKPPVTFFLWFLGTYVAFFGVASQRYENRVDIIENRASSIFTQLSSGDKFVKKNALSRVAAVQNMPCPVKPEILMPLTVFRSLFGSDSTYKQVVELMKELIEDWKYSLEETDISGVDLRGVNLSSANLKSAILIGADLRGANFSKADLQNAVVLGVKFEGAYFMEANLQGLTVYYGNIKIDSRNITRIKDAGTKIDKDIQKIPSYYSVWDELSKAQSLYRAKLSPNDKEILKKKNPNLFNNPFPAPPSIRRIDIGH